MKNYSIWEEDLKHHMFPPLDKDETCDVLIIGGGLTGVNTAYYLKDKGLKVILIEKNSIGSGVTSRSNAKITILQEDIYSKIIFYQNKNKANQYLQSQIEGKRNLLHVIRKENIDCNLEESNSYLFANENKNIEKVKKIESFLKENAIKTFPVLSLPNFKKVAYGFYIENCYTFNPIKYLNGLVQTLKDKIQIYEDTRIKNITKDRNGYIASTEKVQIKCKNLVLACNYPFFIFPFLFPLKSTLQKSYLKATEKKNLKFNAINLDEKVQSYRYYTSESKSYEFYLGVSRNLSIHQNDKENYERIDYQLGDYFWSNRDVYTKDYLPYIGKINDHLLLGTGYQTWGMINSFIAGEILAKHILKEYSPYMNLFNPKRTIGIIGLIRYPYFAIQSIYSFIKGKIKPNKKWLRNVVYYDYINGKKVAIYIDEHKKKHMVKANCPHLCCTLLFNEVDKQWECPCHGSTFTLDGESLNGPSKEDISINEK